MKASVIKKKQQLSTQNLVDHVNREAEIFDAVDHTSDEPINVFTIKDQRHNNDFESDNESDYGSINENEIENILSPPFIPESPLPLDPNDITYTPTDDEHTSSVKKLRRSLEPRSDSDSDWILALPKNRNSFRTVDPIQVQVQVPAQVHLN